MPELVAATAFVLTARGPSPPDALVAGEDQIWVVTHTGALSLTELQSVSGPEPRQIWRLLTAVGEVALPDGAYVSTDGGRFLAGAEVAELLRRGQEVDVDVVSPSDVEFSAGGAAGGREQLVRDVLAVLPRKRVQIPAGNGAAAAVEAATEAMLKTARLSYRRTHDERWLVYALDDLPDTTQARRADFEKQAEALLLATAWEPDGDGVVSRVRLQDSLLLQRLFVALVGARQAFEVKWTPKYAPVECRVRVLLEPPWGAFAAVDAATLDTGEALELALRGRGRPVVSLAVTTSQL